MEHKNKFIKSLCIAAFLSILCLPQINSKAMAQAPVPTLDRLNQEGATIPDTEPPQVYPESAYTLTEIENADPENLPQNAITLYDKTEVTKYYDPQTGQEVAADDRLLDVQYKEVTTIQTTPKYYLVNLKDSVTNIGQGDTTKYFEWSQNSEGRLELKEVSAPTEGKTTITVKYDTSSLQKRFENTTDNSSKVTTGTFLNQTTGSTSGNQYGGAIYNNGSSAKLGDINADFIGNYVTANSFAYGGAIYNTGTIGDITGDFIGNYAIGRSPAEGGAIHNTGTIGDITGNFIGNYASSTDDFANGGAIYNYRGTIGNITGDFIGNYVFSSTSVYGGAIRNNGTIGNITGDFVNNYIFSENSHGLGGAIFMDVGYKIGNITGDFVNNYIKSVSSYALGGAIYFYSKSIIGDITGNFIENYVLANTDAHGGAINNNGFIENITGNFIGNYANGKNAIGGAISNGNYEHTSNGTTATIKNINGDFIYNYAYATDGYASGGAIHNERTIGDITGDFIGNYASSTNYTAKGGAIFNEDGTIGNITGDFIGNYASASGSSSSADGGAIYNYRGTIGNITGDFIGNYASASGSSSSADGGAIYNYRGTIGDITGDFIGNYAISENDYAYGGAIYNSGTIGDITGDFIGNYASGNTYTLGGAIANMGTIMGYDVSSDKIYDISQLAYKVTNPNTGESFVLYELNDAEIQETNALLEQGYKIVCNPINYPQMTPEEWAEFEQELNAYIESGEFRTELPFGDDAFAKESGSFINSSFINNYAESKTGNAVGGAIFSTNNINIVADNGQSIFSGNKTISNGKEEQNAIGMYGIAEQDASTGEYAFVDMTTGATSDKNTANLKLEAKNNGVIVFDDTIRGGAMDVNTMAVAETPETAFDLKVTGDSTGKVILNNDVINANISLDNTNLYLGREDVFNQSQSLSLNSGSIYMNNQSVGTMHVPTLNLNGNTNISVDADLANKSMDRITADTYNVKDNAMLNVNNVVLLSDAKEDVTNIQFADEGLKGNVAYTGASPIAYSPIWKYDVSYNPDDGFFSFVRGAASSGNASDAFNPSVLASPVATQAGAYTTQLQTFNYAFQHADTFMNIPYIERLAIINEGKYALSPTGDATDVGTYSPLLLKEESAGFWVKPYASFENVPLKNGPKVSNINYGTLVGYDSPLTSVGNGFERVLTGYIGYNGASQRYSGVDAYQNGGLLGGTATFYRGNFFNATTLSVGASAGDASTMYGSENYTMLLAGLGNKTGYNFEFFDGGMILQPSMLISYTFVNTFDYTNGAGVRIESDPMHAIQLAPGIKLIGNTKNGWQPYIGVSMVWNLLDESKVTADSVRLPEMSIKPYVQYGVGLQKRVNDKFLAFGQAMIHNGGRNGVSLSAGLRWKIGRE